LPTAYPAMGSGEVSWWCVDKNDSTKRIKCAMEVNGNGSPQSEVATMGNVVCNEGSVGSCSVASGSSASIGDFSRNDCKIACEKQLTSAGCFISLAGVATTATAPCYCKAGGEVASPVNGGILFFGGNYSYTPSVLINSSNNTDTSTAISENDTNSNSFPDVSNTNTNISDATKNEIIQSKSSQFCGTYAREWGINEQWPTSWKDLNASGGLCKVDNRNTDTSKNVIYLIKEYPINPPTSKNPAIWSCWQNDSSTIIPCIATRKGDATTDIARAKEDTQGECGTASSYYDGKARESEFTGRTFCNRGVPEFYNEEPVVSITDYNDTSQFPFPTEERGRTKWTCLGTQKNSGLCDATIIKHGDSVWRTVATTATKVAVAVAAVYGFPLIFSAEISAQIDAMMNAYGWANFAGSTANTLQTGNIDLNTGAAVINEGLKY